MTQRRKGTQRRKVDENELAVVVVDGALAVHKALGPGLLESVYVAALAIELTERRLNQARRQTCHEQSLI